MKTGMTKRELIKLIGRKIQRAKPQVRSFFLKGMERQKKSQLAAILRKARVDKDGWGISLV